LEAGCCLVKPVVKSDQLQPFGTIKESGYGCELGYLGIREFVHLKRRTPVGLQQAISKVNGSAIDSVQAIWAS
jgi:hypothetical protein